MEKIALVNNLWGGIIYDIKLDMIMQRIIFNIKVHMKESIEYYELIFEKVFEFNFINEDKSYIWNYIELTSIEIDKKENEYSVLVEIWDHEFIIKCENYKVNLVYEESVKQAYGEKFN